MSVCLFMYRIRDDVDLVDTKDAVGHLFSDQGKHEVLEIPYEKQLMRISKHNKSNRLMRCLEGHEIKTFEVDYLGEKLHYTYITVDVIEYRQTWEMRSNFFNRECTSVWCDTPEKMNNFFKKCLKNSETEIYEAFNRAWKPGYVFHCTW